jgi:hypothetical protein
MSRICFAAVTVALSQRAVILSGTSSGRMSFPTQYTKSQEGLAG